MRLPSFLLAFVISTTTASFCGDSAIPYSFEVLPDGQPVLGCARPTCFGWSPSGLPASHTASFYRINRRPDGFLRKERASIPPFQLGDIHVYHPQTAKCEESFGSSSCDQDDQWVGGISPLLNVSMAPTALQCCTFEPLRLSVDRGVATLLNGQIVVGGEVSKKGKQFAFDYISDVSKSIDEDGNAVYEIKMRRFPCLPLPTKAHAAGRNFNRKALQAPTAAMDPIALQHAIEGPFPEDHNQEGGEPVTVPTTDSPTPAPYHPHHQQSAAGGSFAENSLWPVMAPPPPSMYPTVPGLLPPRYPTIPPPFFPTPPPSSYPLAPLATLPQPPPQPQCCGQPPAPAYYPAASAPGANAYYCFSGDTKVLLIDGNERRMDELKVEDWVQTIDEGKMVFSPVTLWLHRNPEKLAVFREITLEDGRTLKITGKHYIFKTTCTANPSVPVDDVTWEAVFAETVEEGDCLYTEDNEETMRKTRVVSVKEIREKGIYAPLTPNGKIMVNGVLASCHSVVQSNSLQQSFFTYVDSFFSLTRSFFGNTTTDIRELPLGMDLLMELLEQILPKNLVTM